VRGAHTTIYPVDLPPWLLRTDVMKMVEKFRAHLRDALSLLSQQDASSINTHSRAPSLESNAGFSIDSDDSGGDISIGLKDQ
jgi:hypothetical protein